MKYQRLPTNNMGRSNNINIKFSCNLIVVLNHRQYYQLRLFFGVFFCTSELYNEFQDFPAFVAFTEEFKIASLNALRCFSSALSLSLSLGKAAPHKFGQVFNALFSIYNLISTILSSSLFAGLIHIHIYKLQNFTFCHLLLYPQP